MIQRIQSLFLLAASILAGLVVISPISHVVFSDGSEAKLLSLGLKNTAFPWQYYYQTFPIAVLAGLSCVLSLTTILLYQNRVLQMRFCVYNILITLGLAGMIVFYYFKIRNGIISDVLSVSSHRFTFIPVLPFVNIILLFQAFRAIRRDDLLVKSYDRLR